MAVHLAGGRLKFFQPVRRVLCAAAQVVDIALVVVKPELIHGRCRAATRSLLPIHRSAIEVAPAQIRRSACVSFGSNSTA